MIMLMDLSLRDILTDIPHDTSSILVYLMIVLFIGFIWYGNKKRGNASNEADTADVAVSTPALEADDKA